MTARVGCWKTLGTTREKTQWENITWPSGLLCYLSTRPFPCQIEGKLAFPKLACLALFALTEISLQKSGTISDFFSRPIITKTEVPFSGSKGCQVQVLGLLPPIPKQTHKYLLTSNIFEPCPNFPLILTQNSVCITVKNKRVILFY